MKVTYQFLVAILPAIAICGTTTQKASSNSSPSTLSTSVVSTASGTSSVKPSVTADPPSGYKDYMTIYAIDTRTEHGNATVCVDDDHMIGGAGCKILLGTKSWEESPVPLRELQPCSPPSFQWMIESWDRDDWFNLTIERTLTEKGVTYVKRGTVGMECNITQGACKSSYRVPSVFLEASS